VFSPPAGAESRSDQGTSCWLAVHGSTAAGAIGRRRKSDPGAFARGRGRGAGRRGAAAACRRRCGRLPDGLRATVWCDCVPDGEQTLAACALPRLRSPVPNDGASTSGLASLRRSGVDEAMGPFSARSERPGTMPSWCTNLLGSCGPRGGTGRNAGGGEQRGAAPQAVSRLPRGLERCTPRIFLGSLQRASIDEALA
jgi:hypothetical protein